MTIAIPEEIGSAASGAIDEGTNEASKVGDKVGLTGAQKAGAISGLLPKPRTSHPYIVGLALIMIGGFGLIGSITGSLPTMIAALFVPNALTDSSGNTPGVLGVVSAAAGNPQTITQGFNLAPNPSGSGL